MVHEMSNKHLENLKASNNGRKRNGNIKQIQIPVD